MDPIQILIWFLVAILVLGIIYYVMVWLKVPEAPRYVVLLIVALLLLLGALGKGRLF